MANQCVVGVYESFEKAQHAVRALEASGFPNDQVSLVTHDVGKEVPREDDIQYGDKTEKNAAKGSGLGGLTGILLGAALMAIPGVGPLVIAGPIAVGMTGAIVGGFLGAMSGWGVHEDHVRQYEEKVREGSLLVVANGDPLEVDEAYRVLRETDAQDVHLHAESSEDSPEIDDRVQ